MELTTIVGACGSVLSFVLFLPQARHTWVNRHRAERLAGISSLGQVCVLANATVWAVYGVLADAVWPGAPGLLNAPLAIGTLWRVRPGQRTGSSSPALQVGARSCHAPRSRADPGSSSSPMRTSECCATTTVLTALRAHLTEDRRRPSWRP